jgi:hypothetical protein
MSEKFLEQVESLMPDDALDNIIEGKRALQRFLSNKGVKNVAVKQFRDEMTFTLDDGSQVVVEIKDFKKVDAHEDQEMTIDQTAKTLGSVLSIPDGGLKGNLSPTSRRVKKIKKDMLKKVEAAAKKINL